MEEDKFLIEGIITDYFASIHNLFDFRIKNKEKIKVSRMLLSICIGFVFLNFIPILPGVFGSSYFSFFSDFIVYILDLPKISYDFWTSWSIGVLLSSLLLTMYFPYYKFWSIKDKKYAISPKLLDFCYAYSIRKELRNYLVNERPEHLEKCIKYCKIVYENLEYIPLVSYAESQYFGLTFFFNHILENFKWIELSPKTVANLNALSHFRNKIIERLNQKLELNLLFPSIDFLILYEFSKIKPSAENSCGKKIGEFKDIYFDNLAKEINLLSDVPTPSERLENGNNKIQNILISIQNLFTQSNIVTIFLCWLFLLNLLFVSVGIIVMNIFMVKFDSTIMVGLLSVPFMGAITLATTIYNRNRT